MVLDYNIARQAYDEHGHYQPNKNKPFGVAQGFGTFSPAYACSNEQTARVAKLLRPAGKNALAIAGSGDMPFVLTASGAGNVDTFDVSQHADLMMRVKIGMLQSGMTLRRYRKFLYDAQVQGHFFTNAKMMDIVSQSLTADEIEYLDKMSMCRIIRNTKSQNWFPYLEQYRLMQCKVNQPYNFIRADIHSVLEHVQNKKYDIIYLSNVFDYVTDFVTREPDELAISFLLERFAQHLNPRGVIVVNSLMRSNRKYCIKIYLENIAKNVRQCGDMIYDEYAKAMLLKTK